MQPDRQPPPDAIAPSANLDPAEVDFAKRIVAAMSDDERQSLSALMQRRDDALRAVAAGLADVTAIKDRVAAELQGGEDLAITTGRCSNSH